MTDTFVGKYIKFVECPPTGKTQRWEVKTQKDDKLLGRISWYGAWRGYTFSPAFPTIFEQDCLRDIANFIEDKTKNYKVK